MVHDPGDHLVADAGAVKESNIRSIFATYSSGLASLAGQVSI